MTIVSKFILQKKSGRDSKGKIWKTEKFISGLKNKFPRVFSEGLGQCTKTEVGFELKDDIRPEFKAKRNIPFSALNAVDQELVR